MYYNNNNLIIINTFKKIKKDFNTNIKFTNSWATYVKFDFMKTTQFTELGIFSNNIFY